MPADPNSIAKGLTDVQETVQQAASAAAPVLHQYAEELLKWIQATKEFALAQAPDFVQQIMQWAFFQNLTNLIFHVAFLIIGLCLLSTSYRFLKKATAFWKENRNDHDHYRAFTPKEDVHFGWLVAGTLVPLAIGTVTLLPSFFLAWGDVMTLVQIYVAPKVYLVEYLSHLVSGK